MKVAPVIAAVEACRMSRAVSVPFSTLPITPERPAIITEVTSRLVDSYDAAAIVGAVDEVLGVPVPTGARLELWDGHTAGRIAAVIAAWAARR